MEEIEHRDRRVGKTSAIDAPQAGSPITEPNHFRGGLPGLLSGFQLEVGNELVNIAQYGDQSTVQQLGDSLLCPVETLSSAGQNRDFDFPPLGLPASGAGMGAKRHHHPIGTDG